MSDEYFIESSGEASGLPFWVYRQVGEHRIDYCQAVSLEAALSITLGLNFLHKLGEATLQTISYEDTSEIHFVVKGEQAQAAYEQALPILKGQATFTLEELALLVGLLSGHQITSGRDDQDDIKALIEKLTKFSQRVSREGQDG